MTRAVSLVNGAHRQEHYDLWGRLGRLEEPDGTWLAFEYEEDSHLARVEHSSGAWLEFSRDRQHQELRALTSRVETIFRAGPHGLPAQIIQRVDGHEWTIHYRYDPRGRPAGVLYPQSAHWLELTRTGGEDGRRLGLDISTRGQAYLKADSDAASGSTFIHFATDAVSLEEFSPGRPPRLRRLAHGEGLDRLALDFPFTLDGQDRIFRAGDQSFAYDDQGRLTGVFAPGRERRYGYDEQGRLLEVRAGGSHRRFCYEAGPALCGFIEADGQKVSFTYDALGRRLARQAAEGITCYTYNLLGLLETVTLPDGAVIRYLYDAWGRLVARETRAGITYYVVGVDGARLAVADATGQITASYLWAGMSCLGRLNGTIGEPLAQTFHRGPGGRLAARGDARGRLCPVSAADPYGADTPIQPDSPGFAGFFGDSATGLLWAGSRWYDPAAAHFLTPDTWLNASWWPQAPGPWRRWLEALPGGSGRDLDPRQAYTWCAHDPINFLDPNGHNWFGLIFSTLSAALWEMQLTSVALQMEFINLVVDILQVFPLFRPVWDKDGYWETSFFNVAFPKGSYRLMVPFALFLNGVMRKLPKIIKASDTWTLGSVVWAEGSRLREMEKAGARDLLICKNASQYLSATRAMAAEINQVPNPNAHGQADVNAAGDQLTGVNLTAPAGQPLDHVLQHEYLSVALPGTDKTDIKSIKQVTPPDTIDFHDPLPDDYRGKKVDIHRLDTPLVKIAKGAKNLSRRITFIRGQVIHFGTALPEDFPTEALTVSEFFPAGVPHKREIIAHDEYHVIRLAKAADQNLFKAGDILRIRSGQKYFTREVVRRRGTTDLLLKEPLPKPTPPDTYASIEVVKLVTSGEAKKQEVSLPKFDRVSVGNLTDLRRYDGLDIENTGGPPLIPLKVERRIVTGLFLSCPINLVPVELSGVDLVVELLVEDITTKAEGTVKSPTEITLRPGHAERFAKDQSVRLAATDNKEALAVVKEVDVPGNRLTLAEDQTKIPVNAVVTLSLLKVTRPLAADQIISPGFPVVVRVDLPTEIGEKALLRLRKKKNAGPVANRRVTAAPTVIAQLENSLPITHAADLTVRRLTPQKDTLRDHAVAPKVQMHFSIDTTTTPAPPVPVNPYQPGDLLHLHHLFASRQEEALGEVDRIDALDFYLKDPVEYLLQANNKAAKIVAPTGTTTPDAHLDEALVLIPSDLDHEPLTRRQALEQHELRHVGQGAIWGPFLASLPVPWLINLGWPLDKTAHSTSKVLGYFSGFGLDILLTAIFWGMGGSHSPTELPGTIEDQDRKVITLSANANPDQVEAFSPGSPVEIVKGDDSVLNTVDSLDAAQKRLTLHFGLDSEKFAPNDQVAVSVSPFEKIRKEMNAWFELKLLPAIRDNLPDRWGYILGQFFNRQNWFPFLGLYPLAYLISGFKSFRIAFEQDASFHSGDLYNNIALGQPKEIYVGQFSRVFAFLKSTIFQPGISRIFPNEMLHFLRIQLPKKDPGNPADPGPATEDVAGGLYANPVSVTTDGTLRFFQAVRFRENYYIPLGDRVENAVGAFFAASRPGTYLVRSFDPMGLDFPLGTSIVFGFVPFLDTGLDFREIKVKPLEVSPVVTKTAPLFETEEVRFRITNTGDPSATYKLRYRGAPPAPAGNVRGLQFTAPKLSPGSGQVTHELEITATYQANHPIFAGPGQSGPARLTESERTNVCQRLTLFINPLTAPILGPLKAGNTVKFKVDIPPREVKVTSAKPPGATTNAKVVLGEGRPATLVFMTPDRVTAPANVTFDLIFGRDPHKKTITINVQVNP